MAAGDKEFGDLINEYLQQRGLSPSWLAQRLGVAPSTTLRWIDGETHPRNAASVVAIADALCIPRPERRFLFEAAGLVYIEQQAPEAETAPPIPAPENSDTQQDTVDAQRHPLWQRVDRVRRWLNEQESDEEKVLVLLRAGTGRVTPLGARRLLMTLGAGWLACWLVIPILMWPVSAEAHWTASIKFGVATLAIPLLVAIQVTPHPLVGAATGPQLARRERMDLLLLQFAGATVSFYVGSAVALTISLVVFALPIVAMTELFAVLLVLLSLLFSYWGARIIPLSRLRMFAAPRQHEGDSTVVLAFLLAGPCTAAFLHFNRAMLLDQGFILALFVVLVGWLSWETRRKLGAVAK